MKHNKQIIEATRRQRDFIAITFFIFLVVIIGHWYKEASIVSPCPASGCAVKVVYAVENKSRIQTIIDYIVYKFGPEGDRVVTEALTCFISESHLNPLAYNWNTNNTADVGVAQINDVHGMSVQDRQDYKKNIDKAYELYKASHGFYPWFGKGCN